MEITTFAEETVSNHVNYCNKVRRGFKAFKPYLFKFPVGTLVTTKDAIPYNIIGAIFGYVFCPITESYRAVLGVNFDVEIDNLTIADKKETLAFNLFTKDFMPVERRMTCLI